MEYEVFEPPRDEFYDQACSAAYSRMFSEGSDFNAGCIHPDDLRFIGAVSDNRHCLVDDSCIQLKGA